MEFFVTRNLIVKSSQTEVNFLFFFLNVLKIFFMYLQSPLLAYNSVDLYLKSCTAIFNLKSFDF